jgi:hypothetical protein
MARVTQDELARYRDGELSASARQRVEEALRTYLERLDRLGDLLRVAHEELASQVSFEGFAERVAAGIHAAEKPGVGERIRVWLEEFFEHRRAVWIPAVSAVSAVAALLLVLPLLHGPMPAAPAPQGTAGVIWAASADSAASTAVPRGSEAILANRGQVTGWEFTVPNDRGEPIGVVWLND